MIEKIMKKVKFSNDVFFKYMLSRKERASLFLRIKIIELATGIRCKKIIVKNPEINPSIINEKSVILDIRAVDENNIEFDIEMQMYGNMDSESKRFQYYGAKIIVEQLNSGDGYEQLRKVYQIIFLNDDSDGDLIEEFRMKNQYNEEMKDCLNRIVLIHMKVIDRILKTKRIEELNDLERLCYLFIKNDYNGIIKEEEDDIIREVVTMYNKFNNDEPMWSLANQRVLARMRDKTIRMQMIERGRAEGKNERNIEVCQKQIMKRYHIDASGWIKTLSNEQMDKILELIFDIDDFEELKRRIL